jgi:predicted transposase YbfD/YdcC
LEDPRDPSKCRHKLIDIVVIAIAAVLCGANDLTGIQAFGKVKIEWFGRFLELSNGIPSHDTFGRVLGLLCPQAFSACFRAWIESVRTPYPEEVIAMDGKTLRRSHHRQAGLGALHILSAWATRNGLVLGQQATDAKSNEITAIPELLEVLMLKGCIVTIDAMGCQKNIAPVDHREGGDYLLALAGDQGNLAAEVERPLSKPMPRAIKQCFARVSKPVEILFPVGPVGFRCPSLPACHRLAHGGEPFVYARRFASSVAAIRGVGMRMRPTKGAKRNLLG